jgi:predicted Zn finger-like uncharacterized protein
VPFRTNCPNCDSSYNLPDNMAGKKVRCKQCQQVFEANPPRSKTAPQPGAAAKKPPAAAPRRPAPADDPPRPVKKAPRRDQDWDEDDAPPSRRRPEPRRRRSLPLILILVFGLLLLLGGGAVAVVVLVPGLLPGSQPKGIPVAQVPVNNPLQGVIPPPVDGNGQQPPEQKEPQPPKNDPVPPPQKDPAQPPPKNDPPEPKKDPVEPPKKDPVPLPPPPEKDVKQLPDTVGDVVAGGGGRFLIMTLPKSRKIAVFDAAERKVTKYLPVAEDTVKIAACLDKLFVILPTANVIQRYGLDTLERETTAQAPTTNPVGVALLGSASRGPLVLMAEGKGFGQTETFFLDPYTLKAIPDLKLVRAPFGGGVKGIPWRISGDGNVLTSYNPGSSPQGHTAYLRSGNEYKPSGLPGEAGGTMAPGPEGRFLYTARGIYTREGKPSGKMGGYGDGSRFCLPAAEGETFYLRIDVPGFPHGDRSGKTGTLYLHINGDDRPLAALPQVEVVRGLNTWGREPFGVDKRFFLIPSAALLVVLPETQDRLLTYRVDIDGLLLRAEQDFLLVLSRPPLTAKKGAEYRYQMTVKSKKGGIKYKLEGAPKGMEVSPTGLIKWAVPADFAEPQADVIVTIGDAGGQEIFHNFTVAVANEMGGADVAQLPPKPDNGPKPDDKQPPPGWKEVKGGFRGEAYTMWVPASGRVQDSENNLVGKGMQIRIWRTVCELKDGTIFAGGEITLPPTLVRATPKVRQDLFRDLFLEEVGGKLVEEKKANLDTMAGKEYLVETRTGLARYRLIGTGVKIFRILVIGTKEKVQSKDAEFFMESFKRKPPAGADMAPPRPDPGQPQADNGPAKPDNGPAKPDDAPRADNKNGPEIQAPKLEQAQVERKLPDTVGDVVVGGAGRFLIFHLPKARKLAVFDANEAKVVKYLPVAEDVVKIAACVDKLIVLLPTANVIQRYSLDSFEREATVQVPTTNPVALTLLGSASRGPLVLFAEGKGPGQGGETLFLDPYTLKTIPGVKLGGLLWGARDSFWRISGDGQVLTSYQPNISPQGHTVRVRSGNEYKAHDLAGDMAGLMAPGPEGRFVYTARGVFTREGKPVGKMGGYGDGSRFCLAAAEGEMFYLCVNVPGFPHGDDKQSGKLYLHVAGEDRPLAALPQVEVPAGLNTWGREPFGADKRFFLIPSAKLLVVLPATQDRLLVYRVDIDELLAKADSDYLVVLSRPPATAKPGDAFSYQMNVKSKKGGVKCKLESGPKGMEVSVTGLIKWAVPADFAEPQADVIVAVSDASGQEIFHSFALAVPAAVKPPAPPDKPLPPQPEKPFQPEKDPPRPTADAARYSANGIIFDYPKEWKVKTETPAGVVSITVANDKGTQALVQLHQADADPKAVRTQLETGFRKAFEGKLVAGSEKAVKRKIAGGDRDGGAMDFEVAKGVAIHFELFAFPLGPKKPVACVVFQHAAFDAEEAKKGFDLIAGSVTTAAGEAKPNEAGNPAPGGLTIKAEDLSKEFKDDEQAASKKYRGKKLTVTGVVDEINEKPTIVVTLNGCEGGGRLKFLFRLDKTVLKKLKIDEPATLQGEFKEVFSGLILLENCRVVEGK